MPLSATTMIDPMGWCAEYVGLPFVEHGRDRCGCDCWGLVRLVYAEQLGVELPDYSECYADTRDGLTIASISRSERERWIAVEWPEPFDVISLRVQGMPWHVGVVVGCHKMLHVVRGKDAAIEDYTRPLWSRRIEGFYRWAN